MSLTIQPLVFQLGRALLVGLLVLLAMGLLAVHAAVFDEEGRAVLELEAVTTFLPAVGAHISGGGCYRRDATRCHGGKPVGSSSPGLGLGGRGCGRVPASLEASFSPAQDMGTFV